MVYKHQIKVTTQATSYWKDTWCSTCTYTTWSKVAGKTGTGRQFFLQILKLQVREWWRMMTFTLQN